jgi:hypothetical protein
MMSEEAPNKTATSKHRCIACRLEIEPGATICVHCNTPQTWRQYLTLSSNVLSLLVALTSVLALIVPVLQKTFHSPYSNVTVSLLNVGGIKPRGGTSMNGLWTEHTFMLALQLALTNSGDRAGILTAGSVNLLVGSEQVAIGSFTLAEPNNPVSPSTVRVADILVPLEPNNIFLFPDKIREGRNGRLLNASGETPTSTALNTLDLSGGSITISAIQSDGKKNEFKLEIEPQKVPFTVN